MVDKIETNFPFIAVPEDLKDIVGEPDEGTRIYAVHGTEDKYRIWADAIFDLCEGGLMSPGGAANYVGVSRAAVHKALRQGRLTGFFYTISLKPLIKFGPFSFLGGVGSYGFIPKSELEAWRKQLEEKGWFGELPTKKDFSFDFIYKASKRQKRKEKRMP